MRPVRAASVSVMADVYKRQPVVRITQFIGIAFRRTSVASPFRNHAGGMGADA